MQKYQRSTRRGWMIFTAPDNGPSGGAAVADPPPAAAPDMGAGDDLSKSIFNEQKAAASGEPPEHDTPPPAADAPPADMPPAKSSVPADVIDPDKPAADAPKVPEAVTEILSAELPKGAKKEQIDSFNKLKTKSAEKLQAALDRAAELEKKIADATPATDLEELRTQLTKAQERADALEEDFARVAFEHSPKFKKQFAEQEATAIELAKSYLDGTEIKPEIIELAARATGRKRIELLKDAGIEDASISAILPHLAQYDTIQKNKQATLANWKTEAARQQEEHTRQTEQQRQKQAERETQVWESVRGKLDLIPFRKSKDNADWNARVDQLEQQAKAIFNGNGADLPTFAETIRKGVAYDVQQEVLDHLKTEVTNLRAENAKLKSSAPGGTISAGSQDGAQPAAVANNADPKAREEQAKSTFNQELTRARS